MLEFPDHFASLRRQQCTPLRRAKARPIGRLTRHSQTIPAAHQPALSGQCAVFTQDRLEARSFATRNVSRGRRAGSGDRAGSGGLGTRARWIGETRLRPTPPGVAEPARNRMSVVVHRERLAQTREGSPFPGAGRSSTENTKPSVGSSTENTRRHGAFRRSNLAISAQTAPRRLPPASVRLRIERRYPSRHKCGHCNRSALICLCYFPEYIPCAVALRLIT